MTRPPSILWLNTDHQLFANRPDAAHRLPLQTRLSRSGFAFTRAYTVLPICSPARASMLTGLYPHNHGLTENDGRFGGRSGLEPSDTLVTGPLAQADYRCGWFGKWHLNREKDARAFEFEGHGPCDYAYPFGAPEHRDYLDRHDLPDPVARVELSGESGTPAGTWIDLTKQSDWFDYEAGTAILETPAETHEAYFVADLAERWLRGLSDEAFFARVDTWGPHPPYLVGGRFADMFEDLGTAASANLLHDLTLRPGHHADYRDQWRERLDEASRDFSLLSRRALQQAALCETALMQLLDVLEDTGRIDDTIIIFTADHGDAVASNGGMLNKGGLMVKETLRIPMVLAGPGIAQGQSDALVGNIDIGPTILDLCGLHSLDTDGISLKPVLSGTAPLAREGLMTEHYGLMTPLWQRAFHRDHWKLVVQEDGFTELYDLAADPSEMHNLADDPACADTLADLRAGLGRALVAHGDETTPAQPLRNLA